MAEIDWIRTTLSTVGGLVYLYVGYRLGRREVSGEARLASRMFGWWWYGLGLVSLTGVGFTFIALEGLLSTLVYYYIVLGVLMVAIAGLLYYLLYVYTGRHGLWKPVAAFYVLFFLGLLWLLHGFGGACMYPGDAADGCIRPDTWSDGDAPALSTLEERPAWVGTTFGIALVLPPLAAAAAYFLLYFRVEGRTQKYRVALVSLGFILWFGFSFVGTTFGVSGSTGWRYASSTISLVASLMILMAYVPPRWIQARLGVEAVAGG